MKRFRVVVVGCAVLALAAGLGFLMVRFFYPRGRPYLLPHAAEVDIDQIIHQIRQNPELEIPYERLRGLDLAHLGAGACVTANRKFAVLLYDKDPRVRHRVLPWLKAQTNHVFRLLDDPDERVQVAAVLCYHDYYGLSGDWLERACSDPSELVRAAAMKRKSDQGAIKPKPAEGGPLRSALKCTQCVFPPKAEVTLSFEIENDSVEEQTIPAGSQIIFSTMPTVTSTDVSPYTYNISIDWQIELAPGEQHVFSVPVSSLTGRENRQLGAETGMWTVTAVCVAGIPDAYGANPGFHIHALRQLALCSAAVKIECTKDLGASFDYAWRRMNHVESWRPPRYEELLPFFDLGKPKADLDRLFEHTGRLIEPNGTATCRNWIHWDYYLLVPFTGETEQNLTVSGEPQLRRAARPDPPSGIPLADWVSAEAGLLLKIEPLREQFPASQPVDIRITLRNVDRSPLELDRPLTPLGENELFRITLCCESERWTEWGGGRAPTQWGKKTARFVRRIRPGPGYSYSSLTSAGDQFMFVNERGSLKVFKVTQDRPYTAGEHTERIKLAPGESYSFITSIGGLDAHYPVGHHLRTGVYRVAFTYKKWPSWIFSNTATIKIVKQSS